MSEELPEDLLREDPRFGLRSIDGRSWIDPYSGLAVPAGDDLLASARAHLARSRPWARGRSPRSLPELMLARWVAHLRQELPREPRLRMFHRDGRWLNPWTGTWQGGISTADGRISDRTIEDIASILLRCPSAAGPMLDRAALDQAARQGAPPAPAPVADAEDDLGQARRVFERMLKPLPSVAGWDLAVRLDPHSALGGDFYDVFHLPDGRVILALGDVSGHGVQAALTAVSALRTLRLVAPHEDGAAAIVARLNEELAAEMDSGRFITLFLAILDPASGALTAICAGHHPAWIHDPAHAYPLRQLGAAAPAIGLLRHGLRSHLRPADDILAPGASMLAYTDGLEEARNGAGEAYGAARITARLLAGSALAPAACVAGLLSDVHGHAGDTEDDVLALLLRRDRAG